MRGAAAATPESEIRAEYAGLEWPVAMQGHNRNGTLHKAAPLPFRLAWYGAVGDRYSFVWFVEHDVFFGGRVAHFFDFYRRISSDLVTAPRLQAPQWATQWLNWPIPRSLLLQRWAHVERFSRRLLASLRDALDMRLGGYLEIFEGSVCRALRWCHERSLLDDGWILLHERPNGTKTRVMRFYMGLPEYQTRREQRSCTEHAAAPANNETCCCFAQQHPRMFPNAWTHKWYCM